MTQDDILLYGDRFFDSAGVYRDRNNIVCEPVETLPPRIYCDDSASQDEVIGFLNAQEPPLTAPEAARWLEENPSLDCTERITTEMRRYVYIGLSGPVTVPRSSIDATVDDARRTPRTTPSKRTPPYPIGYFPSSVIERGDAEIEGLALFSDSVTIIDDTVRGLAVNHSGHLWAHDVTVSIKNSDAVWRWPISVQPIEPLAFEFENWNGSQNPEDIEIEFSATMTPRIDLSRGFELATMAVHGYSGPPEPYHGLATDGTTVFEPGDLIPQSYFLDHFFIIYRTPGIYGVGTPVLSHPHLHEELAEATNTEVNRLQIYVATLSDSEVVDVFKIDKDTYPGSLWYPNIITYGSEEILIWAHTVPK